jgi:DNA (cytosine-5)-methyltransferase 1
LNFIELFAGCGGLSLGLKSTGLNLLMANELSPMAAETYAYNFFDEDLNFTEQNSGSTKRTLWISSAFPASEAINRLRENPFNYPKLGSGHSDLTKNVDLNGKLLIGDISELNKWLRANPKLIKKLSISFGKGEVDLISGGPPCQSFSMAGLRQKDSAKNSLPWEFVTFAKQINPKLILLENVTGILRPFKSEDGKKYFAWFEIARAFAQIGYAPICLHVNAKLVGVPQNRPRFILIGLRSDLCKKVQLNLTVEEQKIFDISLNFLNKEQSGIQVHLEDLSFWDTMNAQHTSFFKDSFLSPLIADSNYVSVKESIDDLRLDSIQDSKFNQKLKSVFKKVIKAKPLSNHEFRTNSPKVKRRFQIYQVLNELSSHSKLEIEGLLKGRTENISEETWLEIKGFEFNVSGKKSKCFRIKSELIEFILEHKTKKRTQKALIADKPAPATLSIPDDTCHYHPSELRTLTVREMARIQSFPDFFEFRSKITTGGKMRSYEVPQYTQVGNAVPPLLGRALGLVVKNLLKKI